MLGSIIFGLTSAVRKPAKPAQEKTGLDPKAMLAFARLGSGFIVWERRKDDSWQIWSKQLDGSAEERLVPEEPGHDHFCPKISPNGALLAFMSYPTGVTAYPRHQGRTGALWLMNLRDGTSEVLVEQARSYGEDRAVLWRDNQRFFYINASGETMEFNVRKKESAKALNYRDTAFGYLPSPDLRHATSGTPEFARVKDGALVHQRALDGCQPYFTSDSLWGYWMGGSGGPLRAMFLPTRHVHAVIERDDPRLPEDRNYIYFPMISPCMSVVAFAASQDEHNHFDGNYDLYLATINPQNLRLVGSPVRYTMFSGCDRFPDVHRRALDLGAHFVEGRTPVTMGLPAGRRGSYHFDFGDKATAQGSSVTHAYTKPGDYWVTATSEGGHVSLRGFVHVDPPSPPQLVRVAAEEDDHILLAFDKAVSITGAKVSVNDGQPLPLELAAENHAVRLRLPAGLPIERWLTIEGVSAVSGDATRMPRSVVPVTTSAWPPPDRGLAFAWRDANAGGGSPERQGRITRKALAFWNETGALRLRGGSVEFPDDGPRLARRLGTSGEFTIEAVITPEPPAGRHAEGVILALADAAGLPDLAISQAHDRLRLDLRGGDSKSSKAMRFDSKMALDPGEPHHVLVRYEEKNLVLFIDGRKRDEFPADLDDLAHWRATVLRAGSARDGSSAWRGDLERIAIYDRALSEDECKAAARACDSAMNSRSILPQWRAVATLVESTPAPSLDDIQPYREALVRNLYEVRENLEGDGLLPKRIVVTQWAWIGGKKMPAQSLKRGQTVLLTLHESSGHPELKPLVTKDAPGSVFDLPAFHDISEWDVPIEKRQ